MHALLSRLKLRHLRIVLALSEQRSAAKVAIQSHISPAAVSKTLAEIEEIVGMELFERGRRGMHPTEAGREVIQGATLVRAQLLRMAEFVEAAREGTRGQITIAYRTLSVQPFLAQAVCAFHDANPLVGISVVEGAIGDLIDQLAEGELDLLFAYEDPRFERPELFSTPVVDGQEVVVVASRAHPLLSQKKVTAKDLSEQQWCLPAHGSRLQHHLDASFQASNTPLPTRGVRTSDIAMTTNLLLSANFLAIFSIGIASQLVAANVAKVLPFSLASRVEPVVAVWNGVLKPRTAAKSFLEFVVRRATEAGILTPDLR
ncbi:MAG: LysR family transcriptional regulator [Polaromonas sp.]